MRSPVGRRTIRMTRVVALATALAAAAGLSAPRAQFSYFGQNKMKYQDFDWHTYRSPHFDIYYYPEEEQFLEQVVSYAESAFLHLSQALDHEPKFRIPLIYYKTHGEFEQTNVTLMRIDEGVGAFAEPLENRMVLPVDQPADKLYALIVHELTHIFEYSILFQDSAGRAIRANPPGWLMEGLASYMAKDEDTIDKMVIRDAVVNGLVPPITRVQGVAFIVYRFGHAAFDFIEAEFGQEGIRTFLSEYRKVLLNSNIEKAIKESFGIEADEFDRRFQKWLRKKYLPYLLERGEPEDYGRQVGMKLPEIFTFSPALSPSGELIAVMTTKAGEIDVAIIDAKDGEMIRNLTKGLTTQYDHLIAAIFEGKNDLSWSPSGDEVAVFARSGNKRLLLIYNAVTGKQVRADEIPVDEAESPAFSPDSKRILFSANKHGQTDIYEYNLETKTLVNITNDQFYDANPAWSADGKTVLYNRRINAYAKVFLLDYEDPSQKTQVTFGESSDIQPSFSRDGKRIYYATDQSDSGVFNIASLDLETGEVREYTDVVSGHFSPKELSDDDGKHTVISTAYWRGRFRLYTVDADKPVRVISPEERAQEPAEIVPFESALQLTLDETEKKPQGKKKYHLETAPAVGVGVASDGTILGNAFLIFSDLLGDHRFWLNVQSISSFTNLDAGYLNMEKRMQWFGRFSDYRDFVVFNAGAGNVEREQADRVTQLSGGVIFPFSTFSRIGTSVGVQNRDALVNDLNTFTDPGTGQEFGFLDLDTEKGTSPFLSVSFVNDTVKFREFGAYHGKRLNFTFTTVPYVTGDLGTYNEYRLDLRTYAKMTRRSLFAWRLFAQYGTGEGARFHSVGGYNQIRGFEYREFFGDRVIFTNLEMRFPLVDTLGLPFGAIRNIRGVFFLDAGTAYTQDGFFFDSQTGFFREFKWVDDDQDVLRDLRASWGLGFSFSMGAFDLTWTFAQRFPFLETHVNNFCLGTQNVADCPLEEVDDNGFHSDFYIGFPF